MNTLQINIFILLKQTRSAISFLLLILVYFLASENCNADTLTSYRGINISFHSSPSNKDFLKISKWGANTVRLVIHADPENKSYDHIYQSDIKVINEHSFKKLDSVIRLASENNLKVVLSTATFPGSKSSIWKDYNYWRKVESLWFYISKRYANNKHVIGFSPIDEPQVAILNLNAIEKLKMRKGNWIFPNKWKNTPKDYFSLIKRIGTIINKNAPDKFVIVSGVGLWGNPLNYRWMKPVEIKNAIYSFNFYLPSAFANGGKKWRPIGSYSSTLNKLEIIKALTPVKIFAKKNSVSVFINGFGLPYHTEGKGAYAWMTDVLDFFEDNQWSWSYFSYSVPFRSPEVKNINGKNIEYNQNTERLKILIKYWEKNWLSSTGQGNE